MDRVERLYKIDQLLQQRRCVPIAELVTELQVSQSTVKRDLEYLRDRLNAPIAWDAAQHGYRYQQQDNNGPRYALPGLWFNDAEIHALLSMEQLLSSIQPGLLGERIKPLRERIQQLIGTGAYSADAIGKRIIIQHQSARTVDSGLFQTITNALMAGQQLRIEHLNRRSGDTVTRELSPQRLLHYRENWYLDAWCHLRNGLRRFSIDAVRDAQALQHKAKTISSTDLQAQLGDGYGIFTGPASHRALLRFTPRRARWVAAEQWHPHQTAQTDPQGRYLLTVPYSDPTELTMDILRHGADVEVLEPQSLRDSVRLQLKAASANYATDKEQPGPTEAALPPPAKRTQSHFYPFAP